MTDHSLPPPLHHSLRSWVWPLSLEEFGKSVWLQQLFVRDRGIAAIGAYRDIGQHYGKGDDWILALGGVAQVPIIVDGCTVNVASMPHFEALKFYKAGKQIYMSHPEPLMPSADALARELELPRPDVGCTLQLSKRGAATPLHFDAAETFVIQLRGTKVWRHAYNHAVPLPHEHYTFGTPMVGSMRDYAPNEVSKSHIVAELKEIVATPGTVIYLPRGHWHATETHEDSVSATIHYRTVTWADLALVAIRRELRRRPEWRRAAFGLGDNATERTRAARELAPLLASLGGAMSGIDTSDLIGPSAAAQSSIDDHAKYRRIGLSSIGVESPSENGGKVVRFSLSTPLHELVNEFEVPELLVPVCLWVNGRPIGQRFGVDDVSRLGVSRADARKLLSTLVTVGFIERVAS